MLNIGVDALEYMKKMNCTTSCIVTYLISYEKGVILSFKHCSESNLIYGELIINVKELLTELFKKTSEMQILFFNIIENINFDFTLNGELDLLLNGNKYFLFYTPVTYFIRLYDLFIFLLILLFLLKLGISGIVLVRSTT